MPGPREPARRHGSSGASLAFSVHTSHVGRSLYTDMWIVSICLLYLSIIMSTSAQSTPRVLVYTATKGYRHESIGTAIQVLGEQASKWNVSFEFSE